MDIKNAEVINIARIEKEITSRFIGLVMTTGYRPEKDYAIRRSAADMTIPLVLNHKLAYELAKAIKYLEYRGDLEVKDLKEYWTSIEEIVEIYG
jgi:carbamoyl-phosphate synthase large subunit